MNDMKNALINLVNRQAWAIQESWLDLIHEILYAHYYSNGRNISEIESQLGRPLSNKYVPEIYGINDSGVNSLINDDNNKKYQKKILVIPVNGTLAKRLNLFDAISGGTSLEIIRRDVINAINNPDIDAIVLNAYSPGGTVAGTKELADVIYQGRNVKPIIGHVDSLAASACYWIVSAAEKITISSETASVGSIGVIAAHYDYSERDKKNGVKRTFIYAGKYKAAGNDAEPLSDESYKIIKEMIDSLYTIFVDNVATYRDVNYKKVLSDWADGRTFLAEEAIKKGMVDEIKTLEDTILMAAEMSDNHSSIEEEYEKAEPIDDSEVY